MKQHGFVHMDALEPSEKMLAQAVKKNIYQKTYCYKIGGKPVDIQDGKYKESLFFTKV